MPITSSEQVQKLCTLAVQQNFADARDMTMAYQTYVSMKIEALQCVYRIEPESGRIVLCDKDAKENLDEWGSLDVPSLANLGQFVPFAANKIALFNSLGKFVGVEDRQGVEIIPSMDGGFIHMKNAYYRMHNLLNQTVPVQDVSGGPYDFYIPPHQSDGVFLADRSAGKLKISDLSLNQVKANLEVRNPGSKKAINFAYANASKTLFVTDHQTPDLMIINLQDRSKKRHHTEIGALGNIAIDEQNQLIYAILSDPTKEPAVLIFSLKDFSHQGTILIPGKLFSQLDDPCDLLAVTPNGKELVVMSYTDEPALCTPILSLFDLQKKQLIQSYTLNQHEKPIGLAFQDQNIKAKNIPGFEKLLTDKGIIDAMRLKGLIRQLNMIEEDKAKPLLDQDISSALSHIEDSFSNEELSQVTEISQQALDAMANDTFFEWQGRSDMKPEEKRILVERMSQLKAEQNVSKTNGVFVLNWLKGFKG